MLEGGGAISEAKELPPVLPKEPVSAAAAESKYSRPSSREKQAALDSGGHLVPSARRHFGALSEVPQQLSALRDALETGESDVFCLKAAAFVEMWQAAREQMESHPAFVDELLVGALVEGFQSVAVSWHALKLACLLARADANALTLLRCGGVAATLAALEGDERAALPELSEYSQLLPPEPAGSQHAGREARIMQVEVALALLQNVAYSSAGVACILNEGGVSLVLRAMRLYAAVAEVGKNGLGVLWNLCDSDDHWSAFLQEGPAMVAVLLGTMQQHPSNKAIEESVIDMLWDVSSTSDGQAH